MPKLIKYSFGKLNKAVCRTTGKEHEDWRDGHVGCVGIICIYESLKKHPGEKFIYFFHDYDPSWPDIRYLRTTYGEITETEEEIIIETRNSQYTFSIGDYDLTDEDKVALMLNVGFKYDELPYDIQINLYTGGIRVLGKKNQE